MVGSLDSAAAWIEHVGLALLFPKADVVLPSLWEQVAGTQSTDGAFVRWTDELGFLWNVKDELPAQGRACVGKHLARVSACVAPRLLPALCAQADREPRDELEAAVIAAIDEAGPLTAPQLRVRTGAPKKDVGRVIARLHHRLVLTASHLVEQQAGWGALAHALVVRKWRIDEQLLPASDAARRELATLVLRAAEELTAADLAGVFGWRRSAATAVLDEVGTTEDRGGFRIWTSP